MHKFLILVYVCICISVLNKGIIVLHGMRNINIQVRWRVIYHGPVDFREGHSALSIFSHYNVSPNLQVRTIYSWFKFLKYSLFLLTQISFLCENIFKHEEAFTDLKSTALQSNVTLDHLQ